MMFQGKELQERKKLKSRMQSFQKVTAKIFFLLFHLFQRTHKAQNWASQEETMLELCSRSLADVKFYWYSDCKS